MRSEKTRNTRYPSKNQAISCWQCSNYQVVASRHLEWQAQSPYRQNQLGISYHWVDQLNCLSDNHHE